MVMETETVYTPAPLTQLSDMDIYHLDAQVGRNIHIDRIRALLDDVPPNGFAEAQFLCLRKEMLTRGLLR